MNAKQILEKVRKIVAMYKKGELGGEVMPEDSNPKLDNLSEENLIYFTLPMALNYQRNSYKLWQSALQTWNDADAKRVFSPKEVLSMSEEELRRLLTKYKVAVQQNKQPIIWRRLCQTIVENGSLTAFLKQNGVDIAKIKEDITAHKQNFPYLSGTKILNYWLYVLTQYTGFDFRGRENLTIAPDTHVIQASLKLGVITKEESLKSNVREIVSDKWLELLKDTEFLPIDLHTPFWIWSRNGFVVEV